MKALILSIVVLCGSVCGAQTVSSGQSAPGVKVGESNWRRTSKRNPALDDDPLRHLEAQDRSERIRSEAAEQNRIRAALGKDQSPLPGRNAGTDSQPSDLRYAFDYLYRVKITNTGAKNIRWVTWEYVFVDPSTGREVGRRRFRSDVKIKPGKSTRLFGYSILPPSDTIDATKAGKKPEDQYSEQIVITRIVYDDNSTWERPNPQE